MRRIGERAPRFRVPALIGGALTYIDSAQFQGRWTALCFVPYVGLVETAFLDHQANTFAQINTVTVRIPLLTDPLGRLHRFFGVTVAQMPVRCQTFLIDPDGIIRFHLVHDLNGRGMDALLEIIGAGQGQEKRFSPVSRQQSAVGDRA